jgi:hypothetical protein
MCSDNLHTVMGRCPDPRMKHSCTDWILKRILPKTFSQVRLLRLVLASVVKKAYILPQPSLIFLDPALKKNVPATKPIIEPSKTSSMCSAIVGRFCKIFGIF